MVTPDRGAQWHFALGESWHGRVYNATTGPSARCGGASKRDKKTTKHVSVLRVITMHAHKDRSLRQSIAVQAHNMMTDPQPRTSSTPRAECSPGLEEGMVDTPHAIFPGTDEQDYYRAW
ncbi:hypothetical protein GCM10017687_37390 [Streptomyces echinatus]